jgi:hypothetical protein
MKNIVTPRSRVSGSFSALAVAGLLALSPNAYSGEVTHETLDVNNVLGLPAIQALIVGCIGEEVLFTGTLRTTLVDGIPTQYVWGPMYGETADGDFFAAASAVTVDKQSNMTLSELGAGPDGRQFRLRIASDGTVRVDCNEPNAFSGEVTHETLDVNNVLGLPAIQALIVGCVGEQVYFTGTVRITLVDGIARQYVWGPMVGQTADGDLFAAASAVTVDKQSNLTLAELGAGPDGRQFRLRIASDGTVRVDCNN